MYNILMHKSGWVVYSFSLTVFATLTGVFISTVGVIDGAGPLLGWKVWEYLLFVTLTSLTFTQWTALFRGDLKRWGSRFFPIPSDKKSRDRLSLRFLVGGMLIMAVAFLIVFQLEVPEWVEVLTVVAAVPFGASPLLLYSMAIISDKEK